MQRENDILSEQFYPHKYPRKFRNWSDWSLCSSCKRGKQTRTKDCMLYAHGLTLHGCTVKQEKRC